MTGSPMLIEFLKKILANDSEVKVVQVLAGNTHIVKDAISLLARNSDPGVREILASNPNIVFSEAALVLANDSEVRVRKALTINLLTFFERYQSNPGCPH